ncbi:hypothetical protein B0H21DRAFT_199426 [Amylocystis lapponica]|nr:hypothetical protein B0H21DRAFT_199426 [Amylocystis lapponica]
MGAPRTRTLRDVVLVLLGATTMHLASSFFGAFYEEPGSITINTQVTSHVPDLNQSLARLQDHAQKQAKGDAQRFLGSPDVAAANLANDFPETTLVSHAPGWTVFRNLYMSNGTMYVVSSEPASSFPDIRLITSTGMPAENTPENIAARMPTAENMDFLSPTQARERWGGDADKWERNRAWSVTGNTFLINDPSQFLDHYYHFCAELMFGAWAFWTGAFTASVDASGVSSVPPVHRMIFTHADAYGWRDRPGFNSYFLRAAFPSLAVEVQEDWNDRIVATSAGGVHARVWHFDTVLFADRSAAFEVRHAARARSVRLRKRMSICAIGSPGEVVVGACAPRGLRFAGVEEQVMDIGRHAEQAVAHVKARPAVHALGADAAAAAVDGVQKGQEVVVTYISRQGTRRHLIDSHHEALVRALTEMCTVNRWELNIVQAERLSKEEQLALSARSTVMLGVHGNGLTHLIMMPTTPISTVIEIFYPGGFAHDYEWTTHAMGMKHFAVWNDTYHTYPEQMSPSYPEGFQGTQIPVHPPTVVRIIEERVAGRLP